MDNFDNLLRWAAKRAGVRLLEVCPHLGEGFQDVSIVHDHSFFGISTKLELKHLEGFADFSNAQRLELISSDFTEEKYYRFIRIASDMRRLSQREGFEFYNGRLARLKHARLEEGQSPNQPRLELIIGDTSYFSAIATNIHFEGYAHRFTGFSDEPALPPEMTWPAAGNWREALASSLLANQLAVHVFLYNDSEIFYTRRGKVGQNIGLWNSTVNGVMELSGDHPDTAASPWVSKHKGKPDPAKTELPDVRATAVRETFYELNIKVRPQDIKWLGLAATLSKSEPFLVGVCRISHKREELAQLAREGREQREIGETEAGAFRREKDLRGIHRKTQFETRDISFGVGTVTIPTRLAMTSSLKDVLRNKVLYRRERALRSPEGRWTDAGAAALLLCLSYLSPLERLRKTLMDLQAEVE